MAYSYTNSKDKTYILHSKTTVLKNGREQTIYFFGKEEKEGALDAVPEGYMVSESKNGLPVLKRAAVGPMRSEKWVREDIYSAPFFVFTPNSGNR